MTNSHYVELEKRIRTAFPELSDGAIGHALNKITNTIRRGNFDCYYVDISKGWLCGTGYYHHFDVEASGVRIYVRVTVD